MSYAREFATEWVKVMAAIVALVGGGSIALVTFAVMVGLPVLVGSFVAFGDLSKGGVFPLLQAGHPEWVIAQIVWMVMLLGAFIASISVHERRIRAESNGGDSAQ